MKNRMFFLIVVAIIFFNQSARADLSREENFCVPSVEQSVANIAKTERSSLAAWSNNVVKRKYYTKNPLNFFGFENHLQGITRLKNTNMVVVSGGNILKRHGQLFVIEMGSRPNGDENFESNLTQTRDSAIPDGKDRMITRIDIDDKVRWHAGGLTRLGNIVVVPIENLFPKASSRILFYDFTNPKAPQKLAAEIVRNHEGAAAVGIERLPDGRIVLLTRHKDFHDFYYSKTENLLDGFHEKFVRVVTGRMKKVGGEGIQLVRQCDGRYFYADFINDGKFSIVTGGKNNHFRLHEIRGLTGNPDDAITINLNSNFDTLLDCGRDCQFRAATGLEISQEGKMRIYGSSFYLTKGGKLFPFAEFAE